MVLMLSSGWWAAGDTSSGTVGEVVGSRVRVLRSSGGKAPS